MIVYDHNGLTIEERGLDLIVCVNVHGTAACAHLDPIEAGQLMGVLSHHFGRFTPGSTDVMVEILEATLLAIKSGVRSTS